MLTCFLFKKGECPANQSGVLYIQLRDVYVKDNIDVEEGISIDLDKKRHVVGIEILDASKNKCNY